MHQNLPMRFVVTLCVALSLRRHRCRPNLCLTCGQTHRAKSPLGSPASRASRRSTLCRNQHASPSNMSTACEALSLLTLTMPGVMLTALSENWMVRHMIRGHLEGPLGIEVSLQDQRIMAQHTEIIAANHIAAQHDATRPERVTAWIVTSLTCISKVHCVLIQLARPCPACETPSLLTITMPGMMPNALSEITAWIATSIAGISQVPCVSKTTSKTIGSGHYERCPIAANQNDA
jgi:hypothetical protein